MHYKICILSILFVPICGWSQGSLGAGTSMSTPGVQTTVISLPAEKDPQVSRSANSLALSLQGQSYLQSTELADSAEQIFNLDHKYNYSNGQKKAQTSLILGGYTNNGSVYGALPEAYFQFAIDNDQKSIQQSYSVGRKIVDVSQIDQNFNLGLTNSFFTQDYVHYRNQGLVGFHQDLSTQNFGFSLSALPIYLPNQGPSIKETNGKIIGSNRWVKKPPEKFAFNDNNKEIIYSIQYDQISKLVFSPGAMAQIRIGQTENHIHLISSYSKRPMNEPVLERETFADLNVVGNVNLVPNVIYDEIMTTDLRYNNNKIKASLSYIVDRPENKPARDFYSIQNLEGISGYSLSFEYASLTLKNRDTSLGFSVADFQGGEIKDLNYDGSDNIFTFTKQRLQYRKPIQLYVNSDLFLLRNGRFLKTKLNWLYDLEQKGSLLTSEFSVQALTSLNARLGVEVLGTEEQLNEDYGFLQQFQSNDRVYGGIEYVF
jgi:hypothetical protein